MEVSSALKAAVVSALVVLLTGRAVSQGRRGAHALFTGRAFSTGVRAPGLRRRFHWPPGGVRSAAIFASAKRSAAA